MKLVVEVSLWDNFSTARSINSISSTKNGIVKVRPCFTLDLSFADSVFGVMVKVGVSTEFGPYRAVRNFVEF